ncbi:hypothetical protein [Natrinema sp. SYSU A 869]|uniref:DUF7512 family protein n=1 Tax=Natrinema sp. SYSU A 869 TaxID=2871694 RepID=UPI001CA40067|nr:hypothetical protein [Natrinema sp. SYSU A 869]
MTDWYAEFGIALQQVPTAHATLPRIFVILLSALLAISVVSESGQAAGTVGFVLAEALVLYVGYGVLMRIASPTARELLVRD